MNILVTFEPRGALYVQFRDATVIRTVELIEDELLIDLDEGGNVLGIEALRPGILSVSLGQIAEAYRLPEEVHFINFDKVDRAYAVANA